MNASCFDRFGNPKKGYSTKQEYRCDGCGLYHISHTDR